MLLLACFKICSSLVWSTNQHLFLHHHHLHATLCSFNAHLTQQAPSFRSKNGLNILRLLNQRGYDSAYSQGRELDPKAGITAGIAIEDCKNTDPMGAGGMPFQVPLPMAWKGQIPAPWLQAPCPHSVPLRRRLRSWQQRLGPPLLGSYSEDTSCILTQCPQH